MTSWRFIKMDNLEKKIVDLVESHKKLDIPDFINGIPIIFKYKVTGHSIKDYYDSFLTIYVSAEHINRFLDDPIFKDVVSRHKFQTYQCQCAFSSYMLEEIMHSDGFVEGYFENFWRTVLDAFLKVVREINSFTNDLKETEESNRHVITIDDVFPCKTCKFKDKKYLWEPCNYAEECYNGSCYEKEV